MNGGSEILPTNEESLSDNDLGYDFNEFQDILKREIDEISRKSGQEKDKEIQELVKLIEENSENLISEDGADTTLYQLLINWSTAINCPQDVLHAILKRRPEAIVTFDGKTTALEMSINRPKQYKDMSRTIIEFMANDIQSYSLAKLSSKVPGETSVGETTSARIIQAAFDFCSDSNVLPLDVELLEKLVLLATPEMLRGNDSRALSPLQQAVRYELSLKEPSKQLELVKLILDKYEGGIRDKVKKGTRFKTSPRQAEELSEHRSVYRWHLYTKDEWTKKNVQLNIQNPQTSPSTSSNSATPQKKGSNGPVGARTSDKSLEKERGPKAAPKNKDDKLSLSRKDTFASGTGAGIEDQAKSSNGITQKQGQSSVQRKVLPRKISKVTNSQQVSQADIINADKASEAICRELGLRFLRWTLFQGRHEVEAGGIDAALDDFFEKRRRYYFAMDLKKAYEDMTESTAKLYFHKPEYYPILRHVSLPRAKIRLEGGGNSRPRYADQLRFLDWLREWKVQKILKLVVEDHDSPHRDEEIEQALAGRKDKGFENSFDVEVLDWRQEDLCPEVIRKAAPHVRELHLQWSGKNAVLRGWSESEGLPLLKCLRVVHLYYNRPPGSVRRSEENIAKFRRRMEEARKLQNDKITANRRSRNETISDTHSLPDIQVEDAGGPNSAAQPVDSHHSHHGPAAQQRWFEYVEEFSRRIPNLDNRPGKVPDRVRIALIDDGVEMFSRGMLGQHSNFSLGLSFDTDKDGPIPPFSSITGHGTFMAKSIIRVCPYADIVPYRLQTRLDSTSNLPRPDPASAAKAIRAAINEGVDIISMSWTIPDNENNTGDKGMAELRSVLDGPKNDKQRIPLMFCAASDDGNQATETLPRSLGNGIFCIGAADSSGRIWSNVSEKDVHFTFPGVDIEDVFPDDGDAIKDPGSKASQLSNLVRKNGKTGSSVATALAAGLAALLIHCTRLGFYYTEEYKAMDIPRTETISKTIVENIAKPRGMRMALKKLSEENGSGAQYTNPALRFKYAADELKKYDDFGGGAGAENNLYKSLGPIATLCRNLCDG